MRAVAYLSVVFLFVLCLPTLRAQNADPQFGVIPYQSYGGSDFDHISLQSGLLNFNVPLYAFPQRGGKLKSDLSAQFNSQYYQLVTICGDPLDPSACNSTIGHTRQFSVSTSPYYTLGKVSIPLTSGFSFVSSKTARLITIAWKLGNGEYGLDGGPESTGAYSEYELMTPDGAMHPTNALYGTSNNTPSESGTLMTLDGTGIRIDSSGIHYSDGTLANSEDLDGNVMGSSTDTMSRPAVTSATTTDYTGCTGPLATTSASVMSVPGPNNETQTYKFCDATAPAYIPASYCGADQDLNTTQNVLQSIVLPNGQTWTFEYDSRSSSDPANVYYGEISKITMPTGGSISYVYTLDPTDCRAKVTTRTVYDGTNSYTWQYAYGGTQTTVTDPENNQTVTTFGGDTYPVSVSYYQGSSLLLKRVDTTYWPAPSINPITPAEQVGGGSTVNRFPQTITTTLDNGSVSQAVYSYCCDYTFEDFAPYDDGQGWVYAGGGQVTANYGIRSEEKIYDYGQGAPGPLLRDTVTHFKWQDDPNYLQANVLNTPTSVTISGSSGTAETSYVYDEPAYIVSSGIGSSNQHSSAPYPGIYGHVTSTNRWVDGGTFLTSHTSWYDTGEVYQQIDMQDVVQATYAYSGRYAYALPDSVTTPLGTTAYTYDPISSAEVSSLDPNNAKTGWTYDNVGRIIRLDKADGGWTTYCYQDAAGDCDGSPPLYSFTIKSGLSGSSSLSTEPASTHEETDFDGLGRRILTKTFEADNSIIQTKTSYDALGNIASASNPFRSSSDPTYGVSLYTYDAIGEKISQTNPDQTSVTWCYNGVAVVSGQTGCYPNESSAAHDSWVDSTDENNNHIQHVSDALARLVSVVEPDPTSGTLTLKTSYSYDALGDLISVDQAGGNSDLARNTRQFSYDWLSRLTSAYNPESGTVTYRYLNQGALCSGDPALPCSRTDARGAITQYSYDTANRLTSKAYTGAFAPNVSYTYDTSSIAGAQNTIGRLTSETVMSGATVLAQKQMYAYDAVGRIEELLECTPSNCATTPYHLSYRYDLAGNLVRSTNGIPNSPFTGVPSDLTVDFGNSSTSLNGASVPSVLLSTEYDSAGRLSKLVSSWSDGGNHPDTLFEAESVYPATPAYGPAGLVSATYGLVSQSSSVTANLSRSYDDRLHLVSESDTTNAMVTHPATVSAGSITLLGAEQSTDSPAQPARGSFKVAGVEGRQIVCESRCLTEYDTGAVTATVGTFTSTGGYQQGSTSSTVAADLAAGFNVPGSPVSAVASGSTVVVTSLVPGSAGEYALTGSSAVDTGGDFSAAASGSTMTGDSPASTTYDSGTVSVTINGTMFNVPWGQNDTPETVANTLANTIRSSWSGVVNVALNGAIIQLTSANTGAGMNWTMNCSSADSGTQTPSFTPTCAGMTGGSDATIGPRVLYSYSIPSAGGFMPNGNIQNVTDSIIGAWNYSYDHLNRLTGAMVEAGNYQGVNVGGSILSWSYDSFGNRRTQDSNNPIFPTGSVQFSGTDNRASGTGLASVPNVSQDTLQYDASGDLTGKDGNTNTAYDAEGRICAAANTNGGYTGYVYDGGGNRVAKGTVTSLSCDLSANGFSPTISYIVGASGGQLTEFDLIGGHWTWMHSNVYQGAALLATYHDSDTYFAFNDWLGTKRVETTPDGLVSTFYSLPYGDGMVTSGNAPDATENHFTGKERDNESGLDYFGARYLSSNLGRWMSPDWSAKIEPVPYAKLENPQSLNLYGYVADNPVTAFDPDGHLLSLAAFQHPQQARPDQGEYSQDDDRDPSNGRTGQNQGVGNSAEQNQAQQQSGAVQNLVNAQDSAMANGKYQPTNSNGNLVTHCSEGACAIAKGTGANLTGILYDSKGNNYDANTQINNLANSPNYHVVTPDQAQALGNQGVLVFGTQHGARHGHIASVRPEGIPGDNPRGRSGPILANIGIFNGVAHQSAVMTPAHGAIIYYAPNQ